jgi:hypothetical protein
MSPLMLFEAALVAALVAPLLVVAAAALLVVAAAALLVLLAGAALLLLLLLLLPQPAATRANVPRTAANLIGFCKLLTLLQKKYEPTSAGQATCQTFG